MKLRHNEAALKLLFRVIEGHVQGAGTAEAITVLADAIATRLDRWADETEAEFMAKVKILIESAGEEPRQVEGEAGLVAVVQRAEIVEGLKTLPSSCLFATEEPDEIVALTIGVMRLAETLGVLDQATAAVDAARRERERAPKRLD